jgi:methanogenic corrinoid protein MtbC1
MTKSTEAQWLTPIEAARRLRIGLLTLHHWVDGGMLTRVDRDGAAWISEADVTRLSLDRAPLDDEAGAARQVLAAALRGDASEALRVVREQTAIIGSVAVALEALIVPCLVEVGARWDDGKYLVSDEHIVSGVLSDVLVHLVQDHRQAAMRGRAACFVLGDDPHSIGARLCQACLENRGVRTYLVGGGVPAYDAAKWVARVAPLDILCFSLPATVKADVAEAELETIAAAAPNARIFLGGAGVHRVKRTVERSVVLRSLFELESVLMVQEEQPGAPGG